MKLSLPARRIGHSALSTGCHLAVQTHNRAHLLIACVLLALGFGGTASATPGPAGGAFDSLDVGGDAEEAAAFMSGDLGQIIVIGIILAAIAGLWMWARRGVKAK